MNRLKKLINEMCPNGVKFMEISELVNYERPDKYIVTSKNYDDSYSIPVLTAGQTFILGYTNETFGVYTADKTHPVIIFDDFTTSIQWVDFNFKVKSSAMKIITPKENINLKFIYYSLKTLKFIPSEHGRQWISKYSKLKIAYPPIEIQKQIVEILDRFTRMEAELEAELVLRKQQYEYYRDKLLTFDEREREVMLSQIANFKNGKGHEQWIQPNGKYIVINSKFISSNGNIAKTTNEQLCPVYIDDILMVMSDLPNGKALAKCFVVDENNKYSLNQRIGCITIKNKECLAKFAYYMLNRSKQLLKFDNHVDQTNLKKNDILNFKIKLPSLERQRLIINSLDKLNAFVNDINYGLPVEINLRHKQYEYYRNKLLTFRELKE